MSHDITCPACGKLTPLLYGTAGVTIVKSENGIATCVGGAFAGYQCAECRKKKDQFLAIEPPSKNEPN